MTYIPGGSKAISRASGSSEPRSRLPSSVFYTAALLALVVGSQIHAATLTVGTDKMFFMPSQALAVARDGDTIEIDAGVYTDDSSDFRQNNLKIVGVGGRAHLKWATGFVPNAQGIWVIHGNNVTINNIEFSGAIDSPADGSNGSGIRAASTGDLTILNCSFHDNQEGILTYNNHTMNLDIESSEFYNNGGNFYYGNQNVYVGTINSLTFKYNYSHHAKVGHALKTRAAMNYIAYNRIMDEGTGNSSFLVDIPVGGDSYFVGNIIQKGPKTSNPTAIIVYGEEIKSPTRPGNPIQSLYAINNTIVNDYGGSTYFFWIWGIVAGKIQNNLLVGQGTIGGSITAVNNLQTTYPGVLDQSNYDYRLVTGSPAIDAGLDPGTSSTGRSLTPTMQYSYNLSGQPRTISGAAIDVGAFEYMSPAFGSPPGAREKMWSR